MALDCDAASDGRPGGLATPRFLAGPFTLTPIADTSARFSDFGPYVPSIDDNGVVAFQATLRAGGSGVFAGAGGPITTLAESTGSALHAVCSHPDINSAGFCCFYAELASGGCGAFLARRDERTQLATSAGPLGPTMNEAGVVAFRAPLARRGSEGAPLAGGASVDGGPDARRGPGKSVPNHGTCGIFTAGDGPVTTIAIAAPGAGHAGRIVRAGGASGSGASGGAAPGGRRFQAFHGLPVINSRGAVVFRADLDDSRQGVFVSDGQRVIAVALTGERFVSLGAFPTQNDDGTVVFCGVERPAGVMGAGVLRGPQAPSPAFWSGQGFNPPGAAGGAAQASGGGVFIARDGHVSRALDTNGPFESFHGALIDGMGRIVFYATPRGAALGVFTGPDADASRLVSLGMELYGAAVVDFALNPVSINSAGQLAVRVRLEDQRQHVLRADPPAGVG